MSKVNVPVPMRPTPPAEPESSIGPMLTAPVPAVTNRAPSPSVTPPIVTSCPSALTPPAKPAATEVPVNVVPPVAPSAVSTPSPSNDRASSVIVGLFMTLSVESADTDTSVPIMSAAPSTINVPPANCRSPPPSGLSVVGDIIQSSPPSTLTMFEPSIVLTPLVNCSVLSPALVNVPPVARFRSVAVAPPSNVALPSVVIAASVPLSVLSLAPAPSVVMLSLVRLSVRSVPLTVSAPGAVMVVVSKISSVMPAATVTEPPVTSSE